jgi:hypothetical protein
LPAASEIFRVMKYSPTFACMQSIFTRQPMAQGEMSARSSCSFQLHP